MPRPVAARSRRAVVAAVLALLVMIGAYVVAQVLGGRSQPAGTSTPARLQTAQQVPPRPSDAQPMTVRQVHDGDTVWLQAKQPGAYVGTTGRVRARLIGLDTPEVQPMECFGQEATDHLRSLTPVGSTVYVITDRDLKDRYDRWLLYLWTPSGTFVNYEIVADGWGTPLRVYPNVAYWPLIETAGRQARAEQRGLWGAC